jgi:hypothetical protein
MGQSKNRCLPVSGEVQAAHNGGGATLVEEVRPRAQTVDVDDDLGRDPEGPGQAGRSVDGARWCEGTVSLA